MSSKKGRQKTARHGATSKHMSRPRQRSLARFPAWAWMSIIGAMIVLVPIGLMMLQNNAASGSIEPASSPAAIAQGKAIFDQTCAACHGQDARGISGLGKDLVEGEFVRQLDDEALVAFIERGRSATDSLNTTGVPMPPKGGNPTLTRQNIADVVAYLRSLKKE